MSLPLANNPTSKVSADNIGLKKTGTVKVEDSGVVSIASSGSSDIDLYATVYVDFWNPGRWILQGEWEWVETGGVQAEQTRDGNVGANDGFGLRIDEAIDVYSSNISTFWDHDGSKSNPDFFQSTSNYGRGWKFQDVIQTKTINGAPVRAYNVGYGFSTLSFKFENTSIGSGDTVEVSCRYGHTWSSTGVSSISIGTGGIEITFSSSNNKWNHGDSWPTTL